jgi:hypothetical protein
LRSDYSAGQGLMEICYTASDLGVPVEFVSAGLCVLEAAAHRIGASVATLRADFPDVIAYQKEAETRNREDQAEVVRQLGAMNLATDQALLLGDSAVLLGLFGTVRAFRIRNWAIGLPEHVGVGEQSITEKMLTAQPLDVSFGTLGRLEERLDDLSRTLMIGDASWRVPSPEMLVIALAARVGEPEANPESPAWAHLAAMLKGGKEKIDVDEILKLADDLGLAPRVHRGLAIVRLIFPELGRMVPSERLSIPAWERVALRLAANKLVQAAIGDDD